jgi:hypothetical protein
MRLHVGQALAAAAGLVSVVNAQAFYGSVEAEIAACGADNFISLGCFENFQLTVGVLFSFNPQGPNPSDPTLSFPDWDPGSVYNSTVTPLNCARVCRGYGYKFAALRDNTCTCGIQLPAGYAASPSAICNVPCGGDSTLTCGGGADAQIYLDPTFAANDQVPITNSNPGIASYYEYLGCYNNPTGFPTMDARASVLVVNIDACFNLCAGLGYPLVHGAEEAWVMSSPSEEMVADLLIVVRFAALAERPSASIPSAYRLSSSQRRESATRHVLLGEQPRQQPEFPSRTLVYEI